MKTLIKKYKAEVIGGLIGLVFGAAYWYFIGCSSGTCAITSKPLNSSLYGALLGVLGAGIFKKEEKSQMPNNSKEK